VWTRFSDKDFKHSEVVEPGYKFNMTHLQAAMGLVQLEKLERFWQRRRTLWSYYDQHLRDLSLTLPPPAAARSRHAYHLYTVLVDEARAGMSRDRLMAELHEANIGTGVHYVAQHLQPYYRDKYGWTPDDFPNARRHSRQTLPLPLGPNLATEDLDDVIAALRRILA
jgi:dTDP-4-amino-4,6-dideoxygalactose transaminase